MRPVELTLDESLALMALAKHLGGAGQIPFTNAAAKALIKIRSQLPAEIRGRLDELDGHVAIRLPHTGAQQEGGDVYERIRQAIANRRAIQCQYESAGDKRGAAAATAAETFLFKPYTLFFSQRAWYAVGHHEGRGELRCLKLNRFTMVKPTERPYFIPDDFSVESYLGNAWRMIRGKKSYELAIRFDKDFADNIAETSWHKTQTIEPQPDGSLLFRCTVDGLDEVTWWVLSMGHHCVVLEPKELAVRVKELAGKILAAYEKAESGREKRPRSTGFKPVP